MSGGIILLLGNTGRKLACIYTLRLYPESSRLSAFFVKSLPTEGEVNVRKCVEREVQINVPSFHKQCRHPNWVGTTVEFISCMMTFFTQTSSSQGPDKNTDARVQIFCHWPGDYLYMYSYTMCTRVRANICRLLREAEGPRPLRRVIVRSNLGSRHLLRWMCYYLVLRIVTNYTNILILRLSVSWNENFTPHIIGTDHSMVPRSSHQEEIKVREDHHK